MIAICVLRWNESNRGKRRREDKTKQKPQRNFIVFTKKQKMLKRNAIISNLESLNSIFWNLRFVFWFLFSQGNPDYIEVYIFVDLAACAKVSKKPSVPRPSSNSQFFNHNCITHKKKKKERKEKENHRNKKYRGEKEKHLNEE